MPCPARKAFTVALLSLVVALTSTSQTGPRVVRTLEQKLADDHAQAAQRLKKAASEYDRWLALTKLVILEVGREPPAVVREHVTELLATSKKYREDWNYGNAVHKANLAIGRLAVRENDLRGARQYLLKAGDTPGSPQLDSFGPNMLLAKELFALGERDVILQYFERCRRFWKGHDEELDEWTASIKANVEPAFGPNLRY